MPIYVAASLAARNGGTFYVVEDVALKGGYQVRADNAGRDAIDAMNRKQGMLCYTQDSGKVWVLQSDLATWSNLSQTIATATSSTPGVMSGVDKANLDSLVTNAVTTVTANLPFTSSGGKTPTISMPAAAAGVDGYLSATDWARFNAKGSGNGTVTGVSASAPLQSSGGVAPVISLQAASSTTNGYLTSSDWNLFNSKANTGGTITDVQVTAPIVTTGGNTPVLSMAAAGASTNGYLKSTDWVTFNNKGIGTVTGVTATSPVVSSGGTTPVISLPAASASANGYLTSTDWARFNAKGSGTVTSVTANASSPLTSTGGTDPVINLPAVTTTSHGYMLFTDKAKLDGIAAGATAYVHPTGDGNMHVPATSTTNSGKVLTAGSSAGSMSWQTPAAGGVSSVNGLTGAVTLAVGVSSVNGKTGAVTLVATDISGLPGPTSLSQYASLGVGTPASGASGEIRATGNITAFYSSDRTLKENIVALPNALERTCQMTGVEFDWTQEFMTAHGGEDDYFMRKHDVGLIAQEVQSVLPEVVACRPDGTLAVKYDRVVALLVEAIKDLNAQVQALKQ